MTSKSPNKKKRTNHLKSSDFPQFDGISREELCRLLIGKIGSFENALEQIDKLSFSVKDKDNQLQFISMFIKRMVP